MTGPKIDTQAPERDYLILKAGNMSNITFHATGMWLMKMEGGEVEFNPDIKPKAGSEQAWALLMDMSRDYNAHVRDLSAAREAAAVERAFRDGLAYATNCRVKDHDQAWQQSLARERLGDTAALDRLIAERVREAVEAEREACRQIVQSVINDPRTKFWGDLAEARARIVARGSKEGRDG